MQSHWDDPVFSFFQCSSVYIRFIGWVIKESSKIVDFLLTCLGQVINYFRTSCKEWLNRTRDDYLPYSVFSRALQSDAWACGVLALTKELFSDGLLREINQSVREISRPNFSSRFLVPDFLIPSDKISYYEGISASQIKMDKKGRLRSAKRLNSWSISRLFCYC